MSEVIRTPIPTFDTLENNIPGAIKELTRQERAVYYCLKAANGRICPVGSLYDAMYGLTAEKDCPDVDIIKVYISKIRKKIPSINIITHHGIGYSLEGAK